MIPPEIQPLMRLVYRATGVLISCLLSFVVLGLALDKFLFNNTGWVSIALILLGLTLGLYGLYKQVSQVGK